ncbi:hypothetical protein SAMN02745244_01651 [Tessaracoccus bendigoensis DSM 12906]|uniref:Secreted protein n=1 Tax=Tessaracoccus bendigoensis DSM 12906 TaxID=1123357 RepID=A0A1M6G9Y2_9ACTN|nr:hypothetical protein [Tessaracoccus bendigoensis]SHJ06776.1 hypothetical protein SAMN02745244_01651 [Tessaracoccus bendigoensis DSM 12906]
MSRRWLNLSVAVLLGLLGALASQSASAEVDVYTTPGEHTVNGRQWQTTCSKYSSNVDRCRTEIWATTVAFDGRSYVESTGWAFNNLTYKPSSRATWQEWNPLVTPGTHIVDGRTWKTECDSSWTGTNGCRSQLVATVVEKTAEGYRTTNKFVFNNIVHITPVACPVTQAQVRTATGVNDTVVQSCERSAEANTWAAADFVVTHPSGEQYYSTAFFRLSGGEWAYAAHAGADPSTICEWVGRVKVPTDLRDHVPYCAA